ncbi:MAG: hypothetical protein PHR74_05820 [Candidatus Omnitrophica bacterium]|nr:hypothetical protein [Candidatus Omnitrophota bacterium]
MGKKRFTRLEIGGKRIDIRLSEKSAGIESWQRKCSTCGRIIAKTGNCFYCGLDSSEFVKKEEGAQAEITIDGTKYSSSDKDLPIDVQELMLRLRNEGYSEELVRDWKRENDLRPREINLFDYLIETIERRFRRWRRPR